MFVTLLEIRKWIISGRPPFQADISNLLHNHKCLVVAVGSVSFCPACLTFPPLMRSQIAFILRSRITLHLRRCNLFLFFFLSPPDLIPMMYQSLPNMSCQSLLFYTSVRLIPHTSLTLFDYIFADFFLCISVTASTKGHSCWAPFDLCTIFHSLPQWALAPPSSTVKKRKENCSRRSYIESR